MLRSETRYARAEISANVRFNTADVIINTIMLEEEWNAPDGRQMCRKHSAIFSKGNLVAETDPLRKMASWGV